MIKLNNGHKLVQRFALLIVLLFGVQAVFARDIGNDLSNPDLCPFLLSHAWFGRDSITNAGGVISVPLRGHTGTLGVIGGGGGGNLNENNGFIVNNSACRDTAFVVGNIRVPREGAIVVTSGSTLRRGANAYTGSLTGRVPQLPTLTESIIMNTSGAQTLNLEPTGTTTVQPGTWRINGDVNLENRRIVIANTGSENTIIYITGRLRVGSGAGISLQRTIPTQDCDDISNIGGLLIMVAGNDGVAVDASVRVDGSIIAPNGRISITDGQSVYSGQLLARSLHFNARFDADTRMQFVPFRITNVQADISGGPFTKNWECAEVLTTPSGNSAVTVSLSSALPAGTNVTVTYTLSGFTGGLQASDIRPNTGTITFTGGTATAQTVSIPLQIVHARNTRAGSFTINLSGATTNNSQYFNVNELNGLTHTVQVTSGRGEQVAPSNITFSQNTNSPVEWHNNSPMAAGQATLRNPIGQIVGQLSAVSPSNPVTDWELVAGGANNSWFNITGGLITTNDNFRADFETARTATIRVRAIAETNEPCVRESAPQDITINIYPWNDNTFVTQASVARTINVGQSTTIDSLAWLVSDADASVSGNQNRALVRGISATTAGAGGWRANTNITASTNIPSITVDGGVLSVSGNTVTFNSTGVTGNNAGFFILARDSAAYGFATDHFDRWIPVNITVNQPPVPPANVNFGENVCRNEEIRIPISILGTQFATGHTFENVSANRGTVVRGTNGTYLTFRANVASGITTATITYSLRNNATGLTSTATGAINVNISPIREGRPVAQDRVIPDPVRVGMSFSVNVSSDWNDNNVGTANLRITPNSVFDIAPANRGIVVNIVGANTFQVTVPREYNGASNNLASFNVSFRYTITDERSFAPCDNGVAISLPARVSFETETLSDWMVVPNPDTIIVQEGGTANSLWNGVLSIMANDENSDGGDTPQSVRIATPPSRGTLTLNQDGTFVYVHDGGEHGPNQSDWTDFFTYYLTNSAGQETPGAQPVFIFINPLNNREPDLVAKTGNALQAREGREFVVIDSEDSDEDWQTTLILHRDYDFIVVDIDGVPAQPSDYEIEIRGDSTIFFRLTKDITDTTEVVIFFGVNDGVDYTHFYFDPTGTSVIEPNNPHWGARPFREFHEYAPFENTLTLTILPNPAAKNFEMRARELEATSTLWQGTNYFANLRGNLTLPEGAWRFELVDSTQNGSLNFNGATGMVEFTHENDVYPEGFSDFFTYYLVIRLPDGEYVRTLGRVDIVISQREPHFIDGGAFYEDQNADGQIDWVVIPFDRNVNIAQTQFEITFNGTALEHDMARFGENADGTEDRSVVMLPILDAPQNTTGGVMNVVVTHLAFENEPQATIFVADRAAPVVNAVRLIRALTPGESDTLIVTMSEASQILHGGGNRPFLFARGDSLFAISFSNRITGENNSFAFVLNSRYNGGIQGGDYIFVNFAEFDEDNHSLGTLQDGVIHDVNTNRQTNPQNRRVPIEITTVTQILSATFFDDGAPAQQAETRRSRGNRAGRNTELPRDGFIDRISFNFGMRIEQELANEIVEALTLPRGLVAGEAAPTAVGFDLAVTEPRNRGARTDVDSTDYLRVADLTIGAITIEASQTLAIDSVAPVILRAEYVVADSILRIVFSEPVNLNTANLSLNTFGFWSNIHNRPYQMTLSAPTQVANEGGRVWEYIVENITIPFPVSGDSIWISLGGHVFDVVREVIDSEVIDRANEAKYTVRAPIFLDGTHERRLDIAVYPQPLRLDGRNAALLPEGFRAANEIVEERGVAIRVDARGPLAEPSVHRGTVRIIDNVGNLVRDDIEMRFIRIAEGVNAGNVVGVAVWDGRNNSGRFVGAAAYVAIANVSVQFYDEDSPRTEILRDMILVTTSDIVRE